MKRSGFRRKPGAKFGNIPVWYDGIKFKSHIERDHYMEFKLLESAKEISEYEYEKVFTLHYNGVKIGNIEPDHFYLDHSIEMYVVSDTKSPVSLTPLFKWKWKHMQLEYPQYCYEIRLKNKTNRYFPKRDQEVEDYQK